MLRKQSVPISYLTNEEFKFVFVARKKGQQLLNETVKGHHLWIHLFLIGRQFVNKPV